LGHELAGTLEEFDDAPGFTKGELVTIVPYYNCGTCIACRAGKPNCCATLKVCGVHKDGGMAEYLAVPASALVHGGNLTLDELALVEPLAIGAHGIQRAAIVENEFVLVIGAGPIGLSVMEFARLAGGKVIAMDVNELRLAFCKQHLQVAYTINPKHGHVTDRLQEITNNNMANVVIDATGNLNAINNAFQYIAHGGRFVLVGLQKGDISFSHPEFHKREAMVMSSRNATHNNFEQVINALNTGQISPSAYITHRVTFNQVEEKFASWLQPESMVIKAIVTM
jgi:2-desacetyl-2-hydroxyethyl bacteriochlorophyllide A dehydrogenase